MAQFHWIRVPGLGRRGAFLWHRLKALLGRRIWLPRAVYLAVPWIYLGSGTAALVGGLYLPDWAWTLPYLLLFGLICLHAGMAIAMRRRHHMRANIASDTPRLQE